MRSTSELSGSEYLSRILLHNRVFAYPEHSASKHLINFGWKRGINLINEYTCEFMLTRMYACILIEEPISVDHDFVARRSSTGPSLVHLAPSFRAGRLRRADS